MSRRAGVLLSCALLFGSANARESLNFYVRNPDEAAEEKPSDPVTPASGEETTPQKQKVESKKTADEPLKAKTKPAASPKTKPEEEPREKRSSPTIKADFKIKSSRSSTSLDPPLDPFGVATAFHSRWDFSSFLITAEEELRFRINAARARTLKLARAFSALSEEVETRQRNLNTAALAAYLLSRDQHSWVPIEGRNLTEAQLLAVRVTMRQDIAAMQSALSDYEVLRSSLNSSAEQVALLEKKGLAAIANKPVMNDDRITVGTAELAAAGTESALGERLVSVETLKAALAAESLSTSADRRQSIASFAPPPPMGRTAPRTVPQMPAVPSDEVMKEQPKGETLPQPEKTALVFETPVNAPVHAARAGVVVFAGPFRGYGETVIIEHEKGMFSVYSHLGNIQVLERQPIAAGAILGRAGTPPELGRSGIHFQVRRGKTPLKPEDWLGTQQVQRLLTSK